MTNGHKAKIVLFALPTLLLLGGCGKNEEEYVKTLVESAETLKSEYSYMSEDFVQVLNLDPVDIAIYNDVFYEEDFLLWYSPRDYLNTLCEYCGEKEVVDETLTVLIEDHFDETDRSLYMTDYINVDDIIDYVRKHYTAEEVFPSD